MGSESIFTVAGPMSIVILGLGGLGILVALAFAGVAFTMRRVPLFAWILVPALIVTVGSVGSWLAAADVISQANAAGAQMAEVVSSGVAGAWGPDYLARWVVGVVFVISAWGAALGAMRVGPYSLWTSFAGIMSILAAVVLSIGCAVYAYLRGLDASAYLLVGLVVFGGLGIGMAAMRRAYHEETQRVAGMRFTASLLLVLAAVETGRALVIGARMDVYAAKAGLPIEEYAAQIDGLIGTMASFQSFAWMIFGAAFLVALFGFVAELGEVVEKYTLIDVVATLLVISALGAFRYVESNMLVKLQNVALLHPMTEMIEEYSYDLPAASVGIEGKIIEAQFPRGGFGDALVYEDETWTRHWKWNGRGWDNDETPAAQAQLNNTLPVLLVAQSGVSGDVVVDMVDSLGGSALLLLRAGELNSELPEEAKFLQGTLLPVAVNTEPALADALWIDGDKSDIYYGATRVFGRGVGAKDLAVRLDAAFVPDLGMKEGPEEEGTELVPRTITSVHMVVGERSRVAHLAEVCTNAFWAPPAGEDGKLVKREVTCTVSKGDVFEYLEKAETARPIEPNDRVVLTQTFEDLPAGTDAVLPREIGAFDFCGDFVAGEAEIRPEGKLEFEFKVDFLGRAADFTWEDKRTIESGDLRKCVKDRISKARFPEYEEPVEAEAPEDAPEDWEPPDQRGTVKVTLTYK